LIIYPIDARAVQRVARAGRCTLASDPDVPAAKRKPVKAGEDVSERRRRDLLDAAFAIVAERGLEGLRTRDVAERAGVNIATLHYYFGTKEALVEALIDSVNGKFRVPAYAEGGTRELRVLDDLHDHLQGAWRAFHATPHLATVLLELAIRSHRDGAARARFRSQHLRWNKIVEELLRKSAAADNLRGDLDPALAARVVTCFMMGATMQLSVNPRAFSFEAVAKVLERALTVRDGSREP
jgi:AcrR family transcriptional regulator